MVAPPLDNTVSTTVFAGTGFLYGGPNPIQTGVAPGTINPLRVAILRGKLKDGNNSALPKVKVTILNHPEFGQTLTRADGMFDMAVNGGGLLTIKFDRVGLMPAQSQVAAPWQDYVVIDDVVLLPYDDRVTAVNLSANTPVQVALGSTVTDSSGSRRGALMFKTRHVGGYDASEWLDAGPFHAARAGHGIHGWPQRPGKRCPVICPAPAATPTPLNTSSTKPSP